ncbi:MAG: DUF1566 domain-containing protein [Spirochaetaceae bacterium]|jgi:hypothetical protein|nr:DUF1566 domain-containing protein [Spirochaetaceae bacterium]
MRNIQYTLIIYISAALTNTAALVDAADLDTPRKNEPPRIGVVKFPVASLDPVDVENAERIRLIASKNIGLSEKLSVIPIHILDNFIAEHEISILKLYNTNEMEKIPVNFAQYLVTGFISAEEKNYRVKINLLDIQKKEFLFSEEALIGNKNETIFWNGIKNLTSTFLEKLDNSIFAFEPEIEKPYRIGDTGPAGGLIFYAKSAYGDGWRYLEAAPPETEFQASWGLEFEDAILPSLFSTSGNIGGGRGNTENFIANSYMFPQNEKTPRLAATGCRALDFGGYTDWFLPSKDELMFMYANLASCGLGGFRGDAYWSSTESSYEYAYFQSFREGKQFFNGYKLTPLAVRAVRAF